MDGVDKLFRDAERLKPRDAMWKTIAANAGLARAAAPEAAFGPGESAFGSRETAFGLRLAASLAIALGVLAALVMVARGPMTTTAGKATGAEDVAPAPVAAASALPASAEADMVVDGDLLDWHADLGGESLWDADDGALLAEPAEEE